MRGEQRVSWASRTDSPQRRTSQSQQQTPRDSPTARREREPFFFSPSEQRYGESPYPMSPETQARIAAPPTSFRPSTENAERDVASAPAEMLQPHRTLSQTTDGPQTIQQQSFDMHTLRPVAPVIAGRRQLSQPEHIELDRTAPLRAMRDNRVAAEAVRKAEEGLLHTVAEEDEQRTHAEEDRGKGKAVDRPGQEQDHTAVRTAAAAAAATAQDEGPVWGESFKVEWIRTERLPFTRTRHLRNPWNHDREVKVSRDGTELEPSVGQALLEEWDKLDEPQPQTGAANVDVGRRLQGKASVSANVLATPESASAGPARTGKTGEGG